MNVTILEGIFIGGMGGAIAGFALWFAQWLREKVTEKADKKKVFTFLYNETKQFNKKHQEKNLFISTIYLATYTNLTQDRIRYICSIHEKIIPKTEKDTGYSLDVEKGYYVKEHLEEGWAVRDWTNEQLEDK